MGSNLDQDPDRFLLKHLFDNGGETGAIIKTFNWAKTSIGAIETWPRSLKIALQILLSSRFPMQILWGADYIQFYNDAYIPIAGNKHPAGIGQRGADCWQEVWDFAGPMLDQVMATGKATWSEDQRLTLKRNGEPEECYFTFSYTPVWLESGSVGGIFIAVHETTQKILSERREQALRLEAQAAKEAAEAANQMKDQFLAVLSHELRSPLSPILGWAKLLRSRKFDQKTFYRALETIERNAQLQVRMIDDLFDLSRILKNKLELTIHPTLLIPLLQNAIETVRSQADTKNIQIYAQLDPANIQITGDANRLQQVFWNLLSNAIKFTPEGGQVNVRLSYDSQSAIIKITDTGRGIATDFLPHVFEHFRQADTTTTKVFGGLGLGLAIAKQIVDQHGGAIQVTSAGLNQGATFTVQLPRAPAAPAASAIADDPADDALAHIRVLAVDDEADSREVLALTLELYGATVVTADSGAAAIALLTTQSFDLLISDIAMPEMDGFTLIQQFRTQPQGATLPAIALTAYASSGDRQRALAAGFQAHLPKPLDPIALATTILTVLPAPPHHQQP